MNHRVEIILEVNGVRHYVDTTGIEAMPLTFNVADIKDISVTKGSFSKTISLPETAENRKVFNYITDLNVDSTFNPGVRQRAYILVDSIMIFEGYFNLTDFSMDGDKYNTTINMNVYADNNDFYSVLGEEYIEDLDMSEFDHKWDISSMNTSWLSTSTYELGYYYPLIDYGYDWNMLGIAPGGSTPVGVKQLFPASYVRNIWNAIFNESGFSWKSTSLITETPFNNLIIPFNGKDISVNPTYVEERQFRVGMSADHIISNPITYPADFGGPVYNSSPSTSGVLNLYQPYTLPASWLYSFTERVKFNDENPPNGDPGGNWNTTLFQYENTTSFPIKQRFGFSLELDQQRLWPWNYTPHFQLRINGISVQTCDQYPGSLNLPVYEGVSAWTQIYPQDYGTVGVWEKYKAQFYSPTFVINPGDIVTFEYNYSIGGNFTNPVPAGTHISVIKSISYMFNEPVPVVDYGMVIPMSSVLPKKVKKRDFIMSIVKMFNLVVEPDKNNKKQLNIETRDYYYGTGVIEDWTDKVDKKQPIKVQVLGDTQNKKTILKYKDDKDFFNTDYKTKVNLSYGEEQYFSDNELVDGEKKIEVIFSPTPIVAIPLDSSAGGASASNIVIPKIGIKNNSLFQQTAHNIRILQKKSNLSCQPWNIIISPTQSQTNIVYPYAGHLDDPRNPTSDINFDQPYAMYYPTTAVTNNTLSEAYWKKMLDEIFDKSSRIVDMQMYLTATDIYNFKFNKNIFIDLGTGGQYYKVNKIEGWEPTVTKTCNVEFIKTKEIKVPKKKTTRSGSWSSLDSDPIRINDADLISARTSSGASVGAGTNNQSIGDGIFVGGVDNSIIGSTDLVVGNNNRVAGINNTVLGDNNILSGSASGNFVQGDNNVLDLLISKTTVFGSNNTIIPDDYGPSSNNFIIGDNVNVSGSNQLVISQPLVMYNSYIDAGDDIILGEFPDNSIINYISSGDNEVRGLGSQVIINFIDSGTNNIL